MISKVNVVLLAIALSIACSAGAADLPDSHYFTTSDGVKIHYYLLGDEGSWVVLIHGYIDSARRMWLGTGIAEKLAENHRVLAFDNRNHGKSDKPEPRGSGRAEDAIELMDHLDIEKAHIHGYSMGGGITGRILASHPGRFITAGFGGSGIYEEDEKLREEAAARDPEIPEAKGMQAAAFRQLRGSAAARNRARGDNNGAAAHARRRLDIDLTTISIPVIAINGEFDRPYSKSQRLERELKHFKNVILPGKNHMSAVGVGAPMDQTYIHEMVQFINNNDG